MGPLRCTVLRWCYPVAALPARTLSVRFSMSVLAVATAIPTLAALAMGIDHVPPLVVFAVCVRSRSEQCGLPVPPIGARSETLDEYILTAFEDTIRNPLRGRTCTQMHNRNPKPYKKHLPIVTGGPANGICCMCSPNTSTLWNAVAGDLASYEHRVRGLRGTAAALSRSPAIIHSTALRSTYATPCLRSHIPRTYGPSSYSRPM